MPTEVKQRRKTQSQKQSDEITETTSANCKDEAQKVKFEAGNNRAANESSVDIKSVICLLSLVACGALSW